MKGRVLRRLCLLGLAVVTLTLSAGRGALWLAAWPYRHAPARYEMPVEGLDPAKVRSQRHAPRAGGRRHEGVDLFRPRGAPVRSATSAASSPCTISGAR